MFGTKKPSLKRHLPEHGLRYSNRCDTMPEKTRKVKSATQSMFVRGADGKLSIVTVTPKQGKAGFAGGPTKIVEYMDIEYSEGRAVNVPKGEPCAVCYAATMSHDEHAREDLGEKCLSLRKGHDLCNVRKYVHKVHRHKKQSYVVMA